MTPPVEEENPSVSYYGDVVAVDGRYITIRDEGGPRIPAGTLRRFRVTADLAAGKLPWGAYEKGLGRYKLSDVRVGDKVRVSQTRVNGKLLCEEINIRRRPGGHVPADYGPHNNDTWQWHEYMNAHQDWEEKGIPLPAKFSPPKLVIPVERPAVTIPDTIPLAK